MKQFILTNWYRLLTSTAMLIFACSFFIFAIKSNVVKAGVRNTEFTPSPSNVWMVVKGNTVYQVTWTSYDGYKCKPVCDGL